MAISVEQAAKFCSTFRDPALFDHGHFKQERLNRLSSADRKICAQALKQIDRAKLGDWSSPEPAKPLDPGRLSAIEATLLKESEKKAAKKAPWHKAPFLWIAKKVHSFARWFQNTFLGRISSRKLLDKVATYCQDASNAPYEIEKNEGKILPALQIAIEKKQAKRLEILESDLRNGLLDTYKILLALKSEGKCESILDRAVSYTSLEGLDDPATIPFYETVYNRLQPYFSAQEEKFTITPFINLNQAAVSFKSGKSTEEAGTKKQALISSYQKVAEYMQSHITHQKGSFITTIFKNLYQSAEASVKLGKTCSKTDDEQLQLLEEHIRAVNEQFDSSFQLVEQAINERGETLNTLINGTPQPEGTKAKLQLDKLSEYGLKALLAHQNTLLKKVELLRKKYLIENSK